eukprot:6126_1
MSTYMELVPLLQLQQNQTHTTNNYSWKGFRQVCLPVIIALLLSTIAIAVSISIYDDKCNIYEELLPCNKEYFQYVFALLSSCSFMLLIFNLIEGCKVRLLTNYYITSKHMNKSYIL